MWSVYCAYLTAPKYSQMSLLSDGLLNDMDMKQALICMGMLLCYVHEVQNKSQAFRICTTV